MEDFLLILKMKQGDEHALDRFVRKYYSDILRYCRYHCGDMAYAEDLTQETFLKFFGSIEHYQHAGKAKNYLYTIARNLCINLSTKRSFEVAVEGILEQAADKNDVILLLETRLDMEQALKQLPSEFREVIVLCYFQELKLKEIADILQIGLPLVKYRLKRGKELLKVLLGKEEEHEAGKRIEGI